jgi:TonB family protein
MLMRQRIVCFSLLTAFFFLCCHAFAKEKPEEKAGPLLKAAADRSLLHTDGSSPFRVRLNFTVYGSKPRQMQGTYTWLVSDGGRWRKEVTFSDYADLEVGNGSTVWTKRSLDFKPLQAIWLDAVFSNYQYLNSADDTVERYFITSEHHAELRCVDLFRDRKRRKLCFDPEGNLLRADVNELDMTFEYSDYRSAGQKSAPYKVVLKRAGKVVLDGTVESLSTDTKADQPLLEPPAGAKKRGGCLTPTLPKATKKVPPEYPMIARNGHLEGKVTMYALIASDGTVHNLVVIQTAGEALDAASVSAVSHWQYEPAKCGNVPIDSEAAISVNFSLSSHY